MRARIPGSLVAIRAERGNLCSNKTVWWGWEDSNFQPNDYQPPALSIEQSNGLKLQSARRKTEHLVLPRSLRW